ncbi:MAG TPA: signal peptidase II [Acidimicrobiales bacterium]|nr:signal peptidase II [Acidimicrobiales bacterium]
MRKPEGRSRRRRLALLVAVAAVVLAVDQVTKSLAVSDLSHHPVELLGPLALRLAYNTGAAFSIGSSLPGLVVVVALALVGGIVWFARHVPTTPAAVAVGLILGGALGNLADRLFGSHHGAVVDFIYTRYWPTFNVADAAITCGCVLVAVTVLRQAGRRGTGGRGRSADRGEERGDAA